MFKLKNKVIIVTGGSGLLGQQHCIAIKDADGIPIIWDKIAYASHESMIVDVTNKDAIITALDHVVSQHGPIYGLVNNVANDPKVDHSQSSTWSRFEHYDLDLWNEDLTVGLTSSFLCSQIVGRHMAEQKEGVIVNIASDLSIFSPDQRLYKKESVPDNQQPVKPVSYSVVKHGLIGLTKYLATYWAEKNIRVNALSPGGVQTNQDPEFVQRLEKLIPMGRMATKNEYHAALIFLLSNASQYMTGQNIVIDGGRSVW
jgi:NAD(P)-dependent dehydrogenase (short-subunit alcohol dehydrogenase family)